MIVSLAGRLGRWYPEDVLSSILLVVCPLTLRFCFGLLRLFYETVLCVLGDFLLYVPSVMVASSVVVVVVVNQSKTMGY